ncbi:MAG TPA: hypothetical protein VML55_08740 [Planctomycetaceae bacterium]|nr:hypothetical protein [Planctomycetaceae bacterium]
MKSFPRLPWAVGSALIALAAGWTLFGQEGQEPRGEGRGPETAPRGDAAGPESTPGDDPGASPASDAGARLLQQARDNLINKPLEASLAEDILIGRGRFKATGRYVQGPNLKLRLEFTVKVGKTEGTLLEVCDGQILWTHQKIGERPRITRRDVREILDAASQAGHIDDNLITAELGLGGLPALLASIERNMVLEAPREETIDGQTVHVIEGGWTEEFLKRYSATGEAPQELPGNVPERVQIYLDGELYPRRIVYRKKVPGRDFDVPLLTLDIKDIRVNAPVSDREFVFEPERGVFVEDITRQYTERLRAPAQ